MKEKGERERIGEGFGGKGKKAGGGGGLSQKANFYPGAHPGHRQGGSGSGGPPASTPRLRTARGGKEGG
jgi:hypothetical protein